MKSLPDLMAERGKLLVKALAAECDGNVSEAGRRAGIKQAHAQQIAAGTKRVGAKTAARMQEALGLDPGFFANPALGDSPDYRDHLRKGSSAPRPYAAQAPDAAVPVDSYVMDAASEYEGGDVPAEALAATREAAAAWAKAHGERGLRVHVQTYLDGAVRRARAAAQTGIKFRRKSDPP